MNQSARQLRVQIVGIIWKKYTYTVGLRYVTTRYDSELFESMIMMTVIQSAAAIN